MAQYHHLDHGFNCDLHLRPRVGRLACRQVELVAIDGRLQKSEQGTAGIEARSFQEGFAVLENLHFFGEGIVLLM
jgi:hypothetical protein